MFNIENQLYLYILTENNWHMIFKNFISDAIKNKFFMLNFEK